MYELRSVIDKTLKRLGLKNRLSEFSIMENWDIIVGSNIAKHTSVHSMHGGVLFVLVDNPVWMHNLSMNALNIKKKLNSSIGAKVVKEIRFKAGNLPEKQKEYLNAEHEQASIEKLPKNVVQAIDEMVRDIPDQELRSVTAALIKRGKAYALKKEKMGGKICPECNTINVPGQKICFYCTLQKQREIKNKVAVMLWELPWFSFIEMTQYIKDLDESTYKTVRGELIQRLWIQIRDAVKNTKKPEIPNEYVQRYVMIRSGIPPEKITNEIIRQIFGENMVKKLLRRH